MHNKKFHGIRGLIMVVTIGFFIFSSIVLWSPVQAAFTQSEQTQLAGLINAIASLRQILSRIDARFLFAQTYTGGGSCTSSLITLLGDGCHYMYNDSSGSPIYCDGPMTKSAKSGDATATTGCSSSAYPSGSPYPATSPYSSCSSQLISLLGDGCHQMSTDSSGSQIYCDGPMTKSAKSGDATTTAGCASSGGTPYPSGSPYPSTTYPSGSCSYSSQSSCIADSYCAWFSGSGYTYCDSKSSSTYAGDANSCPGFSYSSWDASNKRYCHLNKAPACQYTYPDYLDNTKYTTANCPAVTTSPSPTPTVTIVPKTAIPAPVINGISVTDITQSSATIKWITDRSSNSKVEYWISTITGDSRSDPTFLTDHVITLSGLKASTTYIFNASSQNADYYSGYSYNNKFTTLPEAIPSPIPSVSPSASPSPYPSTSPYPTSCPSSLITLLGEGCHYMYNDSSGSPIYCDGPMTKSARSGDTATTAGCTSSSGTPYPSGSPYPYPSGSPYPTPSSSCSAQLISLLGDGCHYMYNDSSGSPIYCDGPMTKSAKSGDATATTGCSSSGGPIPFTPAITTLFPDSGQIGTRVTITGFGFTATGNRVNFDTGVLIDIPSVDGKTITFTVPEDRVPLCAVTNPRCLLPAPYNLVKPGTYWVSVTNANGTSGSFSFGVVESISSIFSVDTAMTSPKSGAVSIDTSSRIKVKFTREFDPSSTFKEFFRVSKTTFPDFRVSGSFSIFPDGFEFIPSGELEPNTSYTYTVFPVIRDRNGMYLSASYSGSFTTGSVTRINGVLVGKVTDVEGVAVAKAYVHVFPPFASYTAASSVPQNYFSRSVETDTNGAYQTSLPPGAYMVEIYPPADRSNLTRVAPKQIIIATGETLTANITLGGIRKIISGTVLFSNGKPVIDAEVGAYASETRQWTSSAVDANGRYTLKVNGGTWSMSMYPRDRNAAWSWNEKEKFVTFAADQTSETKNIDFTIPVHDATLSVMAVDESGVPFGSIGVIADTHSASSVSTLFSTSPEFRFVGSDGKATFTLGAGTYFVRAYIPPDRGYMNPDEQQVVLASGDAKEIKIIFRKKQVASLLVISGATKIEEGIPVDAFIWAWSERGGFVSTRADNEGKFSFAVTSNERWHVGAGKEYKSFPYKSPELVVEVKMNPVTIELLLIKQALAPLSPTVSVTEAAAQQVVAQVTDGAQITLPPTGAASSGNVQVEIKPTVEAPAQAGTDVVSTVYDVTIHDAAGNKVTALTKEAEIVIPYSEAELKAQGVSEDALVPSYFDEKSSTWVGLDKCTIDKTRNVAICRVDHLTRFAITARANNTPPDAPTDVKLIALSNGRINIVWKNPTNDFDYTKIYRSLNAGELGIVRASSIRGKEFIDAEGLTNGTTYYYTVRTVNIAGNESTNIAQQSITATGISTPTALKTAMIKKAILQTLRQGIKGDEVKALQELLIKEGLLPGGSVTGFFGGLTKGAVIRFQEKYAKEILVPAGLTKGSGIVGPGTRVKINALLGQ